jgi:hypothetical protein
MNPSEERYRIAVAGSTAGFVAWSVGALIPMFLVLPPGDAWIADLLDATIIGAFIGVFGFGVATRRGHPPGGKALILRGGVGGAIAGACGLGISLLLRILWLSNRPAVGIVVAWASTGTFVGIWLGYLRHNGQRLNMVLAGLGGGLGAAVGGIVLVNFGAMIEYVTRAMGLMFTGGATCLCAEYLVWVARRASCHPKILKSKLHSQVLFGFSCRTHECCSPAQNRHREAFSPS